MNKKGQDWDLPYFIIMAVCIIIIVLWVFK